MMSVMPSALARLRRSSVSSGDCGRHLHPRECGNECQSLLHSAVGSFLFLSNSFALIVFIIVVIVVVRGITQMAFVNSVKNYAYDFCSHFFEILLCLYGSVHSTISGRDH